MKYLIIGAGIAGTTAAEELRKADPKAEITLIGRETHPLYSRVLLPHYIKGKVARERVFMKKWEWYSQNTIDYQAGVEVLAIDCKNRFVATDDSREHSFDKLLLTTGSDARLFLEDKRGISYLRTLDDADHLSELLREMRLRKDKHAAIYGGGFMAIEFLNIYALEGISSTLFLRGRGFWNRELSPRAQDILADFVRSHGIEIVTQAEEIVLLGERELEGVEVNGRIYASTILGIGIGSVHETELFNKAGIKTGKGIFVNEKLETAVPGIYAAGDIAEFEDSVIERRVLYGNWMNAQMQARVAAKNMLGEGIGFELVSSYATHLFGKEIVFVGDTHLEAAEETRILRDDEGGFLEVYDRRGRTVGAVLMGDVKARQKVTQAIKEKRKYA